MRSCWAAASRPTHWCRCCMLSLEVGQHVLHARVALLILFAGAVGGAICHPWKIWCWAYLVMVAAVGPVLTAFGDCGQLPHQSRTRIVGASVAWRRCSGIGLRLTLVGLFALKSADWSRLFIAHVCAAQRTRPESVSSVAAATISAHAPASFGVYARNVLLVGQNRPWAGWPGALRAMCRPTTTACWATYAVNGGEAAADIPPRLGNVGEPRRPVDSPPDHMSVITVQHAGAMVRWMESVIRNCDYMGVLLQNRCRRCCCTNRTD